MISEDAIKATLAAHEAEMSELQKKAEFHNQNIVGHNNELRACQNNMIHLSGKIDAIKQMLAPPAPTAEPSEPAPRAAPRRARQRL